MQSFTSWFEFADEFYNDFNYPLKEAFLEDNQLVVKLESSVNNHIFEWYAVKRELDFDWENNPVILVANLEYSITIGSDNVEIYFELI